MADEEAGLAKGLVKREHRELHMEPVVERTELANLKLEVADPGPMRSPAHHTNDPEISHSSAPLLAARGPRLVGSSKIANVRFLSSIRADRCQHGVTGCDRGLG